jgi:hypothetical protein
MKELEAKRLLAGGSLNRITKSDTVVLLVAEQEGANERDLRAAPGRLAADSTRPDIGQGSVAVVLPGIDGRDGALKPLLEASRLCAQLIEECAALAWHVLQQRFEE